LRIRIVVVVAILQSILLLAHLFLYFTWTGFCGLPGPVATLALRVVLLVLAFSFVAASLVSFFFTSPLVTALYRIAAVWMGFLNYLFFAAILTRLAWALLELVHLDRNAAFERPLLGWIGIGLGVAAAIFGAVNARIIHVRHVPVTLRGLPASWRGRTALVASDLHLGQINGAGFSRRIAAMAARLNPDVILIAGDVFDGARLDPDPQAAPLKVLAPPFGVYFATGNHDEFGDTARYLAALRRAGVRVLANERVVVDGLQILGVPHHDSTSPIRLKAALDDLQIDRSAASILINHVPSRLEIVEAAGVSLQVSGHTHGGQFAPFTWITQRIFREFTYGLHAYGALQVFTSYGTGTWGPPLRVGTSPEVVLLRFE
jgi:predicted MPP superfamily phosphohydrolase